MKPTVKTSLLLLMLTAAFFALHFFVYLGNYKSPFDGNEAFPDWFIFVSQAPEPLNIEKLILAKAIYPDYLNPLQNIEFHYADKSTSKIVIIEQGSIFSTDMTTLKGNPETYHDENVDGTFLRGFAVQDYANTLFFLLQYTIIAAFGVVLRKSILKK